MKKENKQFTSIDSVLLLREIVVILDLNIRNRYKIIIIKELINEWRELK